MINKEKRKLWLNLHKEQIRDKNKNWYKSHREQELNRMKKWRIEHPEKASAIKRRKEWRELIFSIGKNKCKICGYDKCFDAIDFHHRNPKEKVFNIGTMMARKITPERILELEKCDSLCANCHREIHSQEKERGNSPKNSNLWITYFSVD